MGCDTNNEFEQVCAPGIVLFLLLVVASVPRKLYVASTSAVVPTRKHMETANYMVFKICASKGDRCVTCEYLNTSGNYPH